MSGFTKGPWRVEMGDTVETESGLMVADVFGGEERLANAHLIAAAPTMFAVLEEIVKWVEQGSLSKHDALFGSAKGALTAAHPKKEEG